MHLLVAPALARLVLVQSDEVAVMTLVQRGIVEDGEIVLAELAEDDIKRVLLPLETSGKGDVEMRALGLEHGAVAMSFRHAFLGQIDVLPAGKHVAAVPFAFAVPDENEHGLPGW